MTQFKPAIAVLAVMLVAVLGWTVYNFQGVPKNFTGPTGPGQWDGGPGGAGGSGGGAGNGFHAVAATNTRMSSLGLSLDTGTAAGGGVSVTNVSQQSPADTAGVKAGDVIQRLGKYKISTTTDFLNAVNRHTPGQTMTINVSRNRRTRNLYLTLPAMGSSSAQQTFVNPAAIQRTTPGTVSAPPRFLYTQPPPAGAIAIAATGPELLSPVSPQFMSGPYFVVYAPATGQYRIYENPTATGGSMAAVARSLRSLGVDTAMAGGFSNYAVQDLTGQGIRPMSGATGTVSESLGTYIRKPASPGTTRMPLP